MGIEGAGSGNPDDVFLRFFPGLGDSECPDGDSSVKATPLCRLSQQLYRTQSICSTDFLLKNGK